jgi:hypothetical protein
LALILAVVLCRYDPRLNGSYDPSQNFNPQLEFINVGSGGVEAQIEDDVRPLRANSFVSLICSCVAACVHVPFERGRRG